MNGVTKSIYLCPYKKNLAILCLQTGVKGGEKPVGSHRVPEGASRGGGLVVASSRDRQGLCRLRGLGLGQRQAGHNQTGGDTHH